MFIGAVAFLILLGILAVAAAIMRHHNKSLRAAQRSLQVAVDERRIVVQRPCLKRDPFAFGGERFRIERQLGMADQLLGLASGQIQQPDAIR